MSKAIILQHAAHQGPGRIIPVFRDFGIPTEVRHLYRGDEVPTDLDSVRVLIVLGGPMRVQDIGSDQAPFLQKEVALLQRMVEHDRNVLGINLGAQLLAHAAGAKVYPNAKLGVTPDQPGELLPEYGWGPVRFPFPGGTEPIVMGLMDGAMMFHWHVDTFDLPKLHSPPNSPPPPAPAPPTGNSLLSTSAACKNQAFRFKTRLFGFQYHIELTEAGMEAMLANATDEERTALGPGGIEQVKEQTPKHYPRYARLGDRVLGNFVQFLKAYK